MIELLLAAQIVCGPGTVPGWLDETGQPTSCVRDCPYTVKECETLTEPPVVDPVEPVELALTGDPPSWLWPFGLALTAAGALTVAVSKHQPRAPHSRGSRHSRGDTP